MAPFAAFHALFILVSIVCVNAPLGDPRVIASMEHGVTLVSALVALVGFALMSRGVRR